MKRAAATIAILLAPMALGQKPKDVDGWGKIKWNMTVGEAKAAVGSGKVHIGDIKLFVTLAAAETEPDRYNALTKPVRKIALSEIASEAARSRNDFDTLKRLLMQKYGAPNTDDERKPVESVAMWVFPSTTITLTFRVVKFGLGHLQLKYEPTDRKALDAL